MAFSDREILARIIECEAGGEGDTGMQAVACVVMNRVQVTYGEYGRLMTRRMAAPEKFAPEFGQHLRYGDRRRPVQYAEYLQYAPNGRTL